MSRDQVVLQKVKKQGTPFIIRLAMHTQIKYIL